MSNDLAEVANILWAGEGLKIETHSLLQFCLLSYVSSLNMKARIMSILSTLRSPGSHTMPSTWYLLNNWMDERQTSHFVSHY